MKISFSTLGCPDFTWEDICVMAKDLNFEGIELRGIENEIFSYNAKPFLESNIKSTLKKLRQMNLSISCVSTGCCIKNEEYLENTIEEGINSIDFASKIGAKYVRILADREPQMIDIPDEKSVLKGLNILAPHAKSKGIKILIETNGYYAKTTNLKALLIKANHSNVAVLWDVHHPFRFFNETVQETYVNIGEWIEYIHIKDSVIKNESIRYKMLGDGDVPVEDALILLRDNGYDGYVSLEWVKRWSSDLEDAYIVFPHFSNYMLKYKLKPLTEKKTKKKEASDYPYKRDTLIDITMGEMTDEMAEKWPDREAFVFPQFDLRYTYSQFRDEVNKYARAFYSIGVRKGDHVAVWSTNRPEWILSMFALGKLGAVLVTVNTAYKIHETEYLLRQSDSSTLILMDGYKDSDYLSIIKKICPELSKSKPGELQSEKLPLLKNIITLQTPLKGAYQWSELKSLSEYTDLEIILQIQKSICSSDVVNMQYTSGTTGFPKGVMLSHYNIINNGKTIGDCMKFSTEDRLLVCVPLFHCFGLVLAVLASFTHASAMIIIDYFKPSLVLKYIEQEKCTAMHGVPTMHIACLEDKDFDQYDLSSLRTGIMAGSPCPVKVMKDVAEKMNMSEITIVYGQTEASPGCTQTRCDDSLEKRVSTVGKPLPGVECKIVDPETGEDMPHGQPGEFLARGYNVMIGYYNMPEATLAAISSDGWLHTGDLAIEDEDGYFKITGRIKDMIIRGGENIYPKEIEDFLYTHPAISDVQVIGVPDKIYGEAILAAIIKKEGMKVTENDVMSFVKENMAKHKTPKYVMFVDSFPMTASGKIQKFKIKDEATRFFGLVDDSE